MLAKERIRELRESNSLIVFFQYESPTHEELQAIKEEDDQIDESEYVILEDFKEEEDLGASVMVLPNKTDTDLQRRNSLEKKVQEQWDTLEDRNGGSSSLLPLQGSII